MERAPESYLKELDGLRFFAFLLVFFHHFPSGEGISRKLNILHDWGWMGVDLFFVLSSFLITRLLIAEFAKTKTISFKQFWIRRILRIWPLYYLLIVLVVFVFPYFIDPKFGSDTHNDILHFFLKPLLLFYSNFYIAVRGYPPSQMLSVLWTISVEEHFYLFWPIILYALLRKGWIKWIAVISTLLTAGIIVLRVREMQHGGWFGSVIPNSFMRFDSFLVGAVCAVYEEKLKTVKPYLFIGLAGALFSLAMSYPKINDSKMPVVWQLTCISLAFGAIVIVATQKGFFHRFLRTYALVYLGRISYGLYMFHQVSMTFLGYWNVSGHLTWAEHFFVAQLFTIILASFSYFTMERFFFKLKDRFTVIKSRPT